MICARLRQQWLPVCSLQKLSSRPQRFLLLDTPLVLYRYKEEIVALLDRCPHRGVPLSTGRVKDGVLQCPYHGWSFNSAGECLRIPGLIEPKNLADKAVPAYPTRSHLGLVFVCLDFGDETLSLYSIPAREPSKEKKNYQSHLHELTIQGEMINIIENTLDATHTHYVHAGLLRKDARRQLVSARLRVNSLSAEAHYQGESRQSGLVNSLFERERSYSVGRFHFPLIAELEYYGKHGLVAAFSFFLSPMTGEEHRAFLLISYPHHWLTSWLKKWTFLPFVKLAIWQDRHILKQQRENLAWFQGRAFKSSELDLMRPHIERILENRSTAYEKSIELLL